MVCPPGRPTAHTSTSGAASVNPTTSGSSTSGTFVGWVAHKPAAYDIYGWAPASEALRGERGKGPGRCPGPSST